MAGFRRTERFGGFLTSAAIFAGITGLWVFLVRDDAYYNWVELFGLRLPVATAAYLTIMPLAGLAIGLWRYDSGDGRFGPSFLGRVIARLFEFSYQHLLLTLFTAAIVAKAFFGWSIDGAVQRIDDRLFDMAARFAPWLAAYLAGFNFGRAMVFARETHEPARASQARQRRLAGGPQGSLLDDGAPLDERSLSPFVDPTEVRIASLDAPTSTDPFKPSYEPAPDAPEMVPAADGPQHSDRPFPSFHRLR